MKSKGFIRIIEATMASLILLAALAYFFEPIVKYSNWPEVLAKIEAQDALVTLYKSGKLSEFVNYNDLNEFDCIGGCEDKVAFNRNLSEMLSKSIDFSIEVRGRPDPIIRIGCNCTNTEINKLNSLLRPLTFNYSERLINIRIKDIRIDLINTDKPKPNILFLFDYVDLGSNVYKQDVTEFLENGGTVFIFTDLTQAQIESDFINRTFGLEWRSGASGIGRFYDAYNLNRTSYRITNYFVNISGLNKDVGFNLHANGVAVDNKTVVNNTNGYSFVKINQLPNGRTVWFADYDTIDVTEVQYIRNLTKAVVMWASGESYKMDEYEKTLPKLYSSVQYIVADKEPYEINLMFWRVFY